MKTFMPRSIAYNYPGFQLLPKGIRRLLLVSETHFFGAESAGDEVHLLRLPMRFPGRPALEVRPS